MVHEKDNKPIIKLIIKKMIEIMESGVIKDPHQQYDYIEEGLLKIIPFNDKTINDVIMEYFDDQNILKTKIDKLNYKEEVQKITNDIIKNKDEIQKLWDDYSENTKNIYEYIKGL